ncbi:MAG: phage major capsid protein [Alsobacter sp.]
MTDLSLSHADTIPPAAKALPDAQALAALDALARGFEAFRHENDARLAALERGRGDVLVDEKIARIDAALDEARDRLDALQLRAARPPLAGSGPGGDGIDLARKAAFRAYMRSGDAAALVGLDAKALSAGSGPDGGFLVPPPAEREVLRRLALISPIRAIASVREIATATYKKAYSTTGPAAGWVGETVARPQTGSQVIADMTFPTMELYANPSATQTLLDDAAIDVESWIAEEIEQVFAEQEGAAFVAGDGTTRPQGFMATAKSTVAAWGWGKLAYLPTGVAAGFPAANPSDLLVDLVYALKAGYRQNASFVMNRRTQAQIRKFKSATGEYLWQPPTSLGAPATLMNFPVVEAEDMPDIAADSFAIACGDFRRGYLIVDRMGIRVLRDPFTAKPYVLFYTTKRVGGGVQDFDAIKLVKFGVA